MRLITGIQISGFRSFKEGEALSISSMTAFVGKNSSGKSNVLRALNLFFNNEVEPGKPLLFARDYYEETPRRRVKKRIAITVRFQIPAGFKFRKEMKPLEKLGTAFAIARSWDIDPIAGVVDKLHVTLEDGSSPKGGADLARQFLGLIFYRYIPNRSVPSRVLKEESQALASSIFSRMKGDTHSSALLSSLTDAASRLLDTATESMRKTGSPLKKPSVATQKSIGEMLIMSGFTAIGEHGLPVQDEDWGAGHQAFFLYEVLKTLDTSYGRFFGWRQATVWGVEEPESALHRDLESRLAGQFREWALDASARLQVLFTTHSPVFTMSADGGYWVELAAGATELHGMSIPQLTHASEARGVSGWVHPVLYFPWNPVVLVEGAIDVAVLDHAAAISGLSHIRFVTVPELNSEVKKGGKDSIVQFLKSARALLANRAPGCPLIVLVDWDVSDTDLTKLKSAYGKDGERYVIRMDPSFADQSVSADFKGVERFYPAEVFVEAHKSGDLVLGIKEGRPLSIASSQLLPAKGKLKDRVLGIKDPEKLKPLLRNLLLVTDAMGAGTPVQTTLKF